MGGAGGGWPLRLIVLLHGLDMVEVSRVADLLAEHGERFLARCFTSGERAYAEGQPRRRAEHLAARFAAKEAVLKALGTGLSGGIAWTEIEVTRDGSGAPGLRLTGVAAARARSLGVRSWAVSLTHTAALAAASVVGEVPARRKRAERAATSPARARRAKRSSKRGSRRS